MVCQSDWLPMIIATNLVMDFAPGGATKNSPARRKRRIIDSRVTVARRPRRLMPVPPAVWLRTAERCADADKRHALPAPDAGLLFHPGRNLPCRAGAAFGALRLREPRHQFPRRDVAVVRLAAWQLFQHPNRELAAAVDDVRPDRALLRHAICHTADVPPLWYGDRHQCRRRGHSDLDVALPPVQARTLDQGLVGGG